MANLVDWMDRKRNVYFNEFNHILKNCFWWFPLITFAIHKSRQQQPFRRLNCVIVENWRSAIFFCSLQSFFSWLKEKKKKKKQEIEMAPTEVWVRVSHACKKLQTKRYPLKFNLHKEQFVLLCFRFSFTLRGGAHASFQFQKSDSKSQLLIMSLFYISFEMK